MGIFSIDDLAARKKTNVYPFLKAYEEELLKPRAEEETGIPTGTKLEVTGRTRTILGQRCVEYRFETPLTGENTRLTGSMWVGTGPGASDYSAFMKAAVFSKRGDPQYDLDGDYFVISRLVAETGGIPFELTYEYGTSRTEIVVLKVARAGISDRRFQVPTGSKKCPKLCDG